MDTGFVLRRMGEVGLNNDELAKRCHASSKYMEQVLKGLRPSNKLLALMAHALECDMRKLAPETQGHHPKTLRRTATG